MLRHWPCRSAMKSSMYTSMQSTQSWIAVLVNVAKCMASAVSSCGAATLVPAGSGSVGGVCSLFSRLWWVGSFSVGKVGNYFSCRAEVCCDFNVSHGQAQMDSNQGIFVGGHGWDGEGQFWNIGALIYTCMYALESLVFDMKTRPRCGGASTTRQSRQGSSWPHCITLSGYPMPVAICEFCGVMFQDIPQCMGSLCWMQDPFL